MIPRENLLDFCNAVNQGIEPRNQSQGVVYLRTDDWKKPVTGFPDLAPEWRHYLLEEPVLGTVLDVMEGLRARVDLGSKNGIRSGMELCVPGQSPGFQFRVISVEPDSCVLASVGWVGKTLEVGQRVASRKF